MQKLLEIIQEEEAGFLLTLLGKNLNLIFIEAIRNNNQAILTQLYSMDGHISKIEAENRKKALEYNIDTKEQDVIDTFPIYSPSDEGVYNAYVFAFVVACEEGNVDVMKNLFEKEVVFESSVGLPKGLFGACEKGHGHAVRWLSDKLPGIVKKEDLSSAYIAACKSGSLLAVQCMYKFRDDSMCYDEMPCNEIEDYVDLDISVAINADQPHIVRWLLGQEKSNLIVEKMGVIFLEKAVSNVKVEVLKALLTHACILTRYKAIFKKYIASWIKRGVGRKFLLLLDISKFKKAATAKEIKWGEDKILELPVLTSWGILASSFVRSYLSGHPNRYNPFFTKILKNRVFLELRKQWIDALFLMSNQVNRRGDKVRYKNKGYIITLRVLPIEVFENIIRYLCADVDLTDPKILVKMVTQNGGCDRDEIIKASGVTVVSKANQGQCSGRSLSPV